MKGLQVSVPQADPIFAKMTYALVPAEREMTVQDLLRHTAGLAYGEITQNAPVKEAYGKAGLYKTRHRLRRARPARRRKGRAALQGAARASARHGVGIQPRESTCWAAWSRRPPGKRLADFLDERLFKPLKMNDTGLLGAEGQDRAACRAAADGSCISGKPNKLIDVSAAPNNDSGGAGGVSTAGDYLRFCQMLLNGGQLDGARILVAHHRCS